MSRPYAEVIGDPIRFSKSPLIHGFWLEKLGIAADYRAVHVAPGGLADYFAARTDDPDWRGCNVTAPHKLAVLDHCHARGPDVNLIGAANTLSAYEGGLSAYNTDHSGFARPLGQYDLRGKQALVIGAGGAARAILYALSQLGIARVTMLNRTEDTARALLDEFGLEGEVLPLTARWPAADLIVNSSIMGMTGKPPLAVDLRTQPKDAIVYDIVYSPLETDLLRLARKRGMPVIDGLSMLIGQAMDAFSVFFGESAPWQHEEELRMLLTA